MSRRRTRAVERPRAGLRSRPAQAGFTLLEIIVVLAVLGFLMVAITQGVRVGLVLWHAQSRRVAQTAELDAAARVLRQLLTALPSPSSDNSNDSNTTTGSTDRFSFIGDLPTGLGTMQRADMVIELQQHRLVLLWVPHWHQQSTAPAPPAAETELVGGVRRLELAYWGRASSDQPPGWLTKWDGSDNPQLIRIRLQFEKGDPRHWPDLIVASRL